jgi:hypothetical protein
MRLAPIAAVFAGAGGLATCAGLNALAYLRAQPSEVEVAIHKAVLQVEEVADGLRLGQPPLHPATRYVLVSGSSENANFSDEVLAQREHWLSVGAKPEEIACYAVLPWKEEVGDDLDQFDAVAPGLSNCRQASTAGLVADLRTLGQLQPDFLYVYITAHGSRPVSKEEPESGADTWRWERRQGFPIFDHFRIDIEALPDGTASGHELRGAHRAGMPDVYLTAGALRSALLALSPRTELFVALSACYSGAFLEAPEPWHAEVITAAPALAAAIASARHDRTSFGCDPGGDQTYFGGALLEALALQPVTPPRLDWHALAEQVRSRVITLESEARSEGDDIEDSLPVLWTRPTD